MLFSLKFSEEKNELLKATRNIGFEDILDALKDEDNLVANIAHPNAKRPHQRLLVVKVRNYAYAVPYVVDQQKDEMFLKTIYPSRTLTKRYVKGDNYDTK